MSRDDSRAALEAAFDQWEQSQEDTPDETTEAEDISLEAEEEETPDAAEPEDETVVSTHDVESEGAGDGDNAVHSGNEGEPEDEPEDELAEAVAETSAPAPNSWRPAAREVWAEIPEAARAEITRQEEGFQKKLGELSEKNGLANRFSEAIEPFKQTIAMEANGDAIEATRNLMGLATRLRGGTQHEKAGILKFLIQQYGVDIPTLDSALAGEVNVGSVSPAPTPPPVADPRIDQMWNQQQTDQQRREQEARTAAENFIASKEFGNDVREAMADIIELSHRRGRPVTLEQAYEQAIKIDPEISAIIASRTAPPQPSAESLRRKKRASTSIKGSPAGEDAPPKPTSRRAQIAAAFDSQSE